MAAVKNTPDSLVGYDRVSEKRVPAPGSPLARLQSVYDDPDSGVFAGDVRDVLAQCDVKCKAVAPLSALITDKDGKPVHKSERVLADAKDIRDVTAHLISSAN